MTPSALTLSTPAWGQEYIRTFCEIVVPNLLAAGNLPALAARLPCTHHIYTDDLDNPLFASEPLQQLRAIADVHLHSIHDLKVDNKYHTMTAAYNDAITRAAEIGSALIFLNADMIYAAGSFARLTELINQGRRCVEIEGFRVNKKPVERSLRKHPSMCIPAAGLVQLAIDNVHPISLCHFWEPENDDGFIPFHTYWRADHGLVARASHLYPLYLYPRAWDRLTEAVTIDWGLSDLAGLAPDETHMVTDSEEIFAVELSDADYRIDPSMPYGGTIREMRAFVAKHCAPTHRERLGRIIRFRARPDEDAGWHRAEIKSMLWYEAVCENSRTSAVALWLLSARTKLSRRGLRMWFGRHSAKVEAFIARRTAWPRWAIKVVIDKYGKDGLRGVLRGIPRQLRRMALPDHSTRYWAAKVIRDKYRSDGLHGVLRGVPRQVGRMFRA